MNKVCFLKKVAKADLNLNKSVLQAIESGRKSTIAERAHSIAAFIIDQLKNCFYTYLLSSANCINQNHKKLFNCSLKT
jgi:hypothetical protein